ncbi:MAG: cobalt transporter CbiM [Deltaproteobacteria bacterium]|nr:MAG: cobalt transporter CbiM [Deltaproteobacteria bacterium]
MHISEGVLAAPVLLAGGAGTLLGLAVGLRCMDVREIPRVALLAAAFFVASLIHDPIGPSNAHLVLNGILGILLGWTAFPAIFIGLFFQAVLFQFGGLTTLGVNTLNMAVPAVIMGALARPVLRSNSGLFAMMMAAISGAGAIIMSAVMAAGSLAFSGESFVAVSKLVFVAHIPIAIAEGVLSVLIISFLLKTKSEVIKGNTHSRTAKLGLVSIVIIQILIVFCSQAHAHKVNLFAWYDGKMIMAEGYFSGGNRAMDSTVLVLDSVGKEVFHGMTDKKGEFSFKPPGNGEYRLVLEAGMGHRAEALVSVKGMQSGTAAPEAVQAGLQTAGSPELQGDGHAAEDAHKGTVTLTSSEFEKILDRKLNPIKEQLLRLAEQGDRVGFRDVVTGLGYIAGLMGLAMYLAQRKRRK